MPLSPLRIQELLDENRYHDCEGFGPGKICVRIAAIADLPSRFGDSQVVAFWNKRDGKEHAAFVHGDVADAENVAVRLHPECLTGDAIGSLRCDCRDQLEAALQDHGLDTVEANLALGFRDDERDYAVAAHMLFSLKVRSIRLLTNNPRKISGLEALGVKVSGRLEEQMDAPLVAGMAETAPAGGEVGWR